MLEGLLDDPPHVVAVDRPVGDDWPEYLKVLLDQGGLAESSIVLAIPGIEEAGAIAGRIAGRQGSGIRRLLLPRGYGDLFAFLEPTSFARLTKAADGRRLDLLAFAQRAQLETLAMKRVWTHYAEYGALPAAFRASPVFDAHATWAASGAIASTDKEGAAELAITLAEVKNDHAVTLDHVAKAAAKSHGWARTVDQRVEGRLVWFKVRHRDKPRGSPRRVLVDPAYAETAYLGYTPSSWDTLARSMWHAICGVDPDRVERRDCSGQHHPTKSSLPTSGRSRSWARRHQVMGGAYAHCAASEPREFERSKSPHETPGRVPIHPRFRFGPQRLPANLVS